MGKSGNPAKRAEQETTPAPVYDPTPVDEDGVEDFDAFWQAQDRKRPRVRIAGRVVELPPALPLQFELEAKRLKASKREDDVHKLVALLFGADEFEHWAKAGMDLEQFKVLLAWAPQRIAGGTLSLAQVAAMIAEADTDEDTDADPT